MNTATGLQDLTCSGASPNDDSYSKAMFLQTYESIVSVRACNTAE